MKWSLILATLSAAATVAPAQEPPWATKVDEAAKTWAREKGPGGVVGVAVDGKVVYAKGFGLASLEHGVPLTPDSVIDVGSVSKQFTAMCVLLLEEEGKLKTSDDIRKYVPEIPTFGQTVTIDQMLHMRSGLRDYLTIWSLEGWNGVDERDDDDLIATMAKQQGLNFTPGSSFLYCNTGYALLATVVRRVTGQSLARYAKEHIFAPLGMDSTRFDSDPAAVPHRATSYVRGLGGWQPLASVLDIVGDGGVLTTVADLAKWHGCLLSNQLGKKDPALVRKLMTPGGTAGETQYACGLVVDALEGVARVGHNGNWLGFNAATMLFPESKVSVFALGTDGSNECSRIADAVAREVLGIQSPEKESLEQVELKPEDLERFAGSYSLPDGRMLTIRLNDATLTLQVEGQPAFPLLAASKTKVFIRSPRVVVTFPEGPSGEIVLTQGGAVLPLVRVEPFEPTTGQLEAWSGTYESREIDLRLTLRAEQGRVRIETDKGTSFLARLASSDRLVASVGTVTLVVDAQGKTRGLTFDAGRATGLRFVRTG